MEDKKLLFSLGKEDFEVQHFRCGGKGGQKQNKTSSGARIIHKESGAIGESREHRSQSANKKAAFLRLSETKEFKNWLKLRICRETGKLEEIEREVDRQLCDEFIKIEVKNDKGLWEHVDSLCDA